MRGSRGRLAAGRSQIFVVVLAHPPVSMARFRTCIPADKSLRWEQGLVAAPLVMVAILGSSFPTSSTPAPRWVGGWLCPRAGREPRGCRDPSQWHRGSRSPFPGAPGSCSSSSPGVQVMLQPGLHCQHRAWGAGCWGPALEGVLQKPFLLLSWPGN